VDAAGTSCHCVASSLSLRPIASISGCIVVSRSSSESASILSCTRPVVLKASAHSCKQACRCRVCLIANLKQLMLLLKLGLHPLGSQRRR